MSLREELDYDVPGDEQPFCAHEDSSMAINCFQGDWVAQHMFSTLYFLLERQQATYGFLKNGAMKWASKVKDLTPNIMAEAVRVSGGGSLQALASNKSVPQLVRDALNAMQLATAQVIGTDGHRRLCRHEGHA